MRLSPRRIAVTLIVLLATLLPLTGQAPAADAAAAPKPPKPRMKVPEQEQWPPYEKKKRPPFCTAQAGPHQRQLERYLRLRVDGKQSPADCKAIQRFQQRYGIRHAVGYAGRVTWGTARLLDERAHPNRGRRCPRTPYSLICVDLTRQLVWVQKGGKVTFKARPMRSGAPKYRTRTGWFRVYARVRFHWSTLYDNAPMPWSQFFSGGQAFHGHYGSIYAPPGSHGCVNMRPGDAAALWRKAGKGTRVYVFGRKPA
ncbi:L,D-transpeptidase family protein [Streptomyces indicus]|uniref:L,D-transpeptidase catalytic domain n=1 Tax=Streptomyces indicus TaxID=417292 RepID=A0A1G9EUQ5_9ACTN|nr:L,D-transpeptidase [Streptomyces indicus]SDK79907.1 L,D-transpeptidase catalytic domain [Streptomyces indicus]